jgi:hypothetical protein
MLVHLPAVVVPTVAWHEGAWQSASYRVVSRYRQPRSNLYISKSLMLCSWAVINPIAARTAVICTGNDYKVTQNFYLVLKHLKGCDTSEDSVTNHLRALLPMFSQSSSRS